LAASTIQLQVIVLINRSSSGLAANYLCDLTHLSTPVTSLRPLDRLELFVPLARTTMNKSCAFTFIGLSLWNQFTSTTCSLPQAAWCLLHTFCCIKTPLMNHLKGAI